MVEDLFIHKFERHMKGLEYFPLFKTITAILLLLFNGIRDEGQINVKNITNIFWSIS